MLCEKPLTINETQCKELVDASRTTQTFLMEGMWIRFLPGIRLVMSLLNEGKFGKIVSIRAPWDIRRRPARKVVVILTLHWVEALYWILVFTRFSGVIAIGSAGYH